MKFVDEVAIVTGTERSSAPRLLSAWAMCLDIGGRYAGAVSGAMNSGGHIGGFTCSCCSAIATMLFAAACVFSQIDASNIYES